MSKLHLTIERLGDIQKDAGVNADVLVLCVNGELVDNQVKTTYYSESFDSPPRFVVEFAFIGDDTKAPVLEMVPINLNSVESNDG